MNRQITMMNWESHTKRIQPPYLMTKLIFEMTKISKTIFITHYKKVNGWRINVNYHPNDTSKQKQDSIKKRVLRVIKRKK